MLLEVERRLTKMIRDFIWGKEAKPTVGLETLYRPIEQGRKKLLDLGSRNEAIELMKAKQYLILNKTRLTLATIADALIGINISERQGSMDMNMYENFLLQDLKVGTQEQNESIPPSMKRMIKVMKKHKVTLTHCRLTPKPKLRMPIWHHTSLVGVKYPGYNSVPAKCMRNKHGIRTMEDLLQLVKHMNVSINPNHNPRKNCKCNECKEMRDKGCRNPQRCSAYARKLLARMDHCWNPLNLGREEERGISKGIKTLTNSKQSSDERRSGKKAQDERKVADTWLNILPENVRPCLAWKSTSRVLPEPHTQCIRGISLWWVDDRKHKKYKNKTTQHEFPFFLNHQKKKKKKNLFQGTGKRTHVTWY
ncbi:hypothetical protein J132_06837 [Termitomyces sp. J132]|nr:hypothetical protein J132_06837 [Termitomyces sp. J132]